jgi:hypothetical protein
MEQDFSACKTNRFASVLGSRSPIYWSRQMTLSDETRKQTKQKTAKRP